MNCNRKKFTGILLFLMMISLLLFAGCTSEVPAVSADPEKTGTSAEPEIAVTRVDTVEGLLEAIAPDADILIEPGYYNLSEYIEGIWVQEGESWNDRHPYVRMEECFDGVELVIKNVDDLQIRGGEQNMSAVQMVVDPRYAAVFSFENCNNLTLSSLTMGHTEQGYCAGNVLNFDACREINLDSMDLYGCGVYGIGAYNGTGQLYVTGCIIRDCAEGPFQMTNCDGELVFRDCSLTGSDGGGYFDGSADAELSFYRCCFGEMETNRWCFDELVYMEDCTWSEVTAYPDYSDAE